MVTAHDALLWLWLLGTAVSVRPTMHRLARLADRDPTAMCFGCRERRRSLLHELPQLEPLGAAGVALLVFVEACAWWILPFEPWARRVAGSTPQPRCTGSSCVANRRHGEA
jgi:hypothetical protein